VAKPAGLAWDAAVSLPVASGTSERVPDLLGLASGETGPIHGLVYWS
jgi:hypothetical protein